MARKSLPSLTFKVAPHAIEDLGSNLYTSFPKVLAEFVANAYDADASSVVIDYDFQKVQDLRRAMRKHYLEEIADEGENGRIEPLAQQKLPETVSVVIRDDGFGMSQSELNERFLWAARKRRQMPPIQRSLTRPLMGRKGLGKLAGFGIASRMEVITKKRGEAYALHATLEYDDILQHETLNEVPIPCKWDKETFGKKEESGTVIRLSRLVFAATKSKRKTVVEELAEHFEFVDPEDFKIFIGQHRVPQPRRKFAFAWPEPDKPHLKLVTGTLETELGDFKYSWRIRFRTDRKSLPASRRGIRVYANHRLAAAPSLFDADTNMHGFRMTDYLDGVVEANFIDEQQQDYIATDRQTLRWESPLLSPLKDFLSEQIKTACKEYQNYRDSMKVAEVQEDEFTKTTIESALLSSKELRFVKKVALQLARHSKKGVEDEQYKVVLPELVRAVGKGQIYSSLVALAEMDRPDLGRLITDIVKINQVELDSAMALIRTKLKAIEALKHEVNKLKVDALPRNEGSLQEIFEEAPWLLDPTFKDYLVADKSLSSTLKSLAKHLQIDKPQTPASISLATRREPDLVFIMGSHSPLQSVLIVELKATNKAATHNDILQLQDYMKTSRIWLQSNGHANVMVRGELVCTPPARDTKDIEERYFWIEADKISPHDAYRVRSYTQVLEETESAHEGILEIGRLSVGDDDLD